MSITRVALLVASVLTILFLAGYAVTGPTASTAIDVHRDSGACPQEDADSATADLSLLTAQPGTTMGDEVSTASKPLCGGEVCGRGRTCCCSLFGGCACIGKLGACAGILIVQ